MGKDDTLITTTENEIKKQVKKVLDRLVRYEQQNNEEVLWLQKALDNKYFDLRKLIHEQDCRIEKLEKELNHLYVVSTLLFIVITFFLVIIAFTMSS